MWSPIESGARLQGASVTITHTSNGRAIVVPTRVPRAKTRPSPCCRASTDVSAARTGFAAVTRRVTLPVGSDATVDLTLPLAGVVDQTTVSAAAPLVEVARSQPSAVVTKADVDTLPVLERNFLVLAQLLPGSGPLNSSVTRLAWTKFGGVADQRAGYTTLVDGGASTTRSGAARRSTSAKTRCRSSRCSGTSSTPNTDMP